MIALSDFQLISCQNCFETFSGKFFERYNPIHIVLIVSFTFNTFVAKIPFSFRILNFTMSRYFKLRRLVLYSIRAYQFLLRVLCALLFFFLF